MTTEHFALQGARAATIAESTGRASMFLAAVSGGLVALGLVATASGLGTAFGPLLGVVLDIGVLEATRSLQGYRMIVFGGLVAVLLVFRPRGLLDERVVHWIKSRL